MSGLSALETFVKRYEVAVELKKATANPVLGESALGKGLDHYQCRLLRPPKTLEVYLSLSAEDDPPTMFDVLFMLALDASGCDMMAGLDKYKEKWQSVLGESSRKPGEIELFWEELEGRCRQTMKVRDFLGPSAYEELISLFGLDEDQGPDLFEETSMAPSSLG